MLKDQGTSNPRSHLSIFIRTDLWRQMYFHGGVCWPITHSEDVHRQLNVPRNILALHVLRSRFKGRNLKDVIRQNKKMQIMTLKVKAIITCLNCTIISFDSSMSLNIPSSLLVNAAPHSTRNTRFYFTQPFETSVLLKMVCFKNEM